MIATVTLNPSLDEWVHVSRLRLGQLNRATGFARYPGGKGINVSRAIHELGGRTIAFALAGGEDGVILRHHMQRLAIPCEFVTVAGLTRNNYKLLTDHPRTLTELNTPGPPVSSSAIQAIQRRLVQRAARFRVVVFSGSLPPGVPQAIYQRWITLLRHRGIPSVLDASGAALRHGLLAKPWLIKPNRQEAEELLGRRLRRLRTLVDAARTLLQLGPAAVILSLGRDGALLACRLPQGVWLARPPRVKVDSAVGAGDSLVGGFLVGWCRSHSILEAFRLGVATGAATAITPGTELCHRADVKRLLPRVTIRRLV